MNAELAHFTAAVRVAISQVYIALCYYKLDYYDVALEILQTCLLAVERDFVPGT